MATGPPTSEQEIHHSTQNFVRVAEDYLGLEGLLVRAIETWTNHIFQFKRQYDRVFAANEFFSADITDTTNKRVYVLLQSYNM